MIYFRNAMIVAALALAGPASAATTFSGLYVFGDNWSDSGNNRAVLGNGGAGQVVTSNSYIATLPYASGTYSNGPVWVNAFATALGLAGFAAPSLGGGGDYAYGGARTTVDGSFFGFPPSATSQVNGFLAGQASIASDGLYIVAVGLNDARATADAIAGGAPAAQTIAANAAAYATGIGNIVASLKAKGATNIVVWNTPLSGGMPAVNVAGPVASGLANSISLSFNSALNARLAGEPAGVSVFDAYGLVTSISSNPSTYGLTNGTDACGAVVGCDVSKYLYWDGIHLTAKGHTLLADALLKQVSVNAGAVPEPTSWAFMICGFGLVGMQMRRHQTIARTKVA
jgi:outer membrane lipase/esterase